MVTYETLIDNVVEHLSAGGTEYPRKPLYYVADFGHIDIDEVPTVTAYSSADVADDVATSARKIKLNSEREVFKILCPNLIMPWAIGSKLLYYIPGYDIDFDKSLNMKCEERYHVKLMTDYIRGPHLDCMTGYYKYMNNNWVYIVNEHQNLRKIEHRALRSDISDYYSDNG